MAAFEAWQQLKARTEEAMLSVPESLILFTGGSFPDVGGARCAAASMPWEKTLCNAARKHRQASHIQAITARLKCDRRVVTVR